MLCLGLTTRFFVLIHSISHFVVGVGEEEHEERVDKTLENEWQEVLRILLNFLPCSLKCGNFSPIDHSTTRLKKMEMEMEMDSHGGLKVTIRQTE